MHALLTFENDDWLTRVWTYQELVNGRDVRIVAEGNNDVVVTAEELLNHVGFAIHRYKKTTGYDAFDLKELHPRLDRLENLILDWRLGSYLERSAYQAMCAMAGRESARLFETIRTAMKSADS